MLAAAAAGDDDDGDYDDDDNDLPLFSSLSCPPGSEGLELSIPARPPSHRMQGRQILCSGPAAFIQARQKTSTQEGSPGIPGQQEWFWSKVAR